MDISPQILHTLQNFVILFVEISLLFVGIDMLVSYINKRYSDYIQKHLSSNSYTSYLKAIVLGAITPFCSCSTIPFFHSISRFFRSTFLIFRKNKIPLIFLAFNVLYPNFAHEFNRGLLHSRRKKRSTGPQRG